MKRLSRSGAFLALPIILAMLSGCTGMVESELDETHARLKALQELAASVNNDLKTLGDIIAELDDKHTIDPSTLKVTEDGYTVLFRDGKTIYIHFGKDGVDGRTLIPIGVRKDSDGLYYWTVDGKDMKDADGNLMRAGATDGVDGIVPQTKVEDGVWKISFDKGKTYTEIATSKELDGVGVFSDIDTSDPTMFVLTLLDGTEIKLPCQTSFKMTISAQDTVLIGGGETLSIPYEIKTEGNSSLPVIVTSGTDGTYISRVEEGSAGKGTVHIQSPEVFSEGYILLMANCGGYSTVKMVSFSERKVIKGDDLATVRVGSGEGTRTVEFNTNFDYTVTLSEDTWLKVDSKPDAGTLELTALANAGKENRSCTVKISPKDNPEYVFTTFQVLQATDDFTIELAPGSPFSFDPGKMTLDIPAEGGDADIWITFKTTSELFTTIKDGSEWIQSKLSSEDGFYKLSLHADANESDTSRKETIQIQFNYKEGNDDVTITLGEINITQR